MRRVLGTPKIDNESRRALGTLENQSNIDGRMGSARKSKEFIIKKNSRQGSRQGSMSSRKDLNSKIES